MHGLIAKLKPYSFFYFILILSLAYCVFQFIYIPYWVLAVDEFVFARQIYEYTYHIPYVDFPPYKGVLGYYLLSIPLFFSQSLLHPLFYIKYEIAFINAIFILLLSYQATRIFDKRAVLLALLAIMANQLFIIYASDLRVDMLSVWGALFATLFVLQKRLRLAGLLLGIAFLISQKVIWYFLAINGALFFCWILLPSSPYSFRSLLTFNGAVILPIFLYVLFWSLISTPSAVLYSLFYEAYIQAGIEFYSQIYLICWWVAFTHGTLLYFLWPLTFLSLFERKIDANLARRLFIVSFASIVLLQFITFKQPFPYNFVFLVPAFFLLYADFISWLFIEKKTEPLTLSPSLLSIFVIAIYSIGLFLLITIFDLPIINYLVMGFPFLTCLFIFSQKNSKLRSYYFISLIGIFIGLGIIYPFYISFLASNRLNGTYQQTMIAIASDLLAKEGDYIGGVPYLYKKEQPISGLKNLIGPELEYLYKPNDKLAPLLLPSLYLTPTTPEQIISEFEKSAVKVIMTNYRILSLPPKIINYFDNNFQHFYGSIYLYSPTISRKNLTFNLKFDGDYSVNAPLNAKIKIDGKLIRPTKVVSLKKGDHLTDANKNYRLMLMPEVAKDKLNVNFRKDNWKKMINPIIA